MKGFSKAIADDAIPKTSVVNVATDAFDVYIGRESPRKGLKRSIWGNPYLEDTATTIKDGTREEIIAKFKEDLFGNKGRLAGKGLLARIPELRGKRMACWCSPKACHGDVLAELANNLPDIESPASRETPVPPFRRCPADPRLLFWRAAYLPASAAPGRRPALLLSAGPRTDPDVTRARVLLPPAMRRHAGESEAGPGPANV